MEKTESGAFVEMGDLLPSRLGLDDAAKSKQKHRLINITEWLQRYVSVIASKQPQRVPDLMGYQVLILEASSEYKNDCWMAYDRRFRQDATSQPQRSWSNIDTTLWLLAFSGQARANRCNICFSLSHISKDSELASDTRDNQPSPPSQYLYRRQGYSHEQHYRRLICYQWNNLRHAHIPIVVMTMFVTSVRRILKPVISITKPYSVLIVTVIASYLPVSPKPHLHHQNH